MSGKGDAHTRVDMNAYKNGAMAQPYWEGVAKRRRDRIGEPDKDVKVEKKRELPKAWLV